MRIRITLLVWRLLLWLTRKYEAAMIVLLVDWCRARGHKLLHREELVVNRYLLGTAKDALRRTGGGNKSKVQNPRKTLLRVTRRLEGMLE